MILNCAIDLMHVPLGSHLWMRLSLFLFLLQGIMLNSYGPQVLIFVRKISSCFNWFSIHVPFSFQFGILLSQI